MARISDRSENPRLREIQARNSQFERMLESAQPPMVKKYVNELFEEIEAREDQLRTADQQRLSALSEVSTLRKELSERERYLNESFRELDDLRSSIQQKGEEELYRVAQREKEWVIKLESLEQQSQQLKARESELQSEKSRHEKRSKEALQTNSQNFIRDTVKDLRGDERFYSFSALGWSLLGGLTLILVCTVFSWTAIQTVDMLEAAISWQALALYSAKGAILASLAAIIARYAFLMAQRNLAVSRSTSDRIHGIKFGQLYIESYGASAGWDQLKDAFSSWNPEVLSPTSGETDVMDGNPLDEKIVAAIIGPIIDAISKTKS